MDDFLQRLKQRKLAQWAAAYLAAAWVFLQVIDLASDSYDWPKLVMHSAFGLLALGFVVMLVLAWYHGERGAQRVSGMELLIVALVLVVGGGVLWNFSRTAPKTANSVAPRLATSAPHARSPDAAQRKPGFAGLETVAKESSVAAPSSASRASAPIPAQPIPAKSVAVLPFENLSTSKDNAYFADGMQDLILTKLADIGDLKVISRISTAKYASHPDDPKTIGQQLGVATILEGSVQKAGNQVLINVQLIDAKTDSHIWAQDYTRTLDNIFGVEGEVATEVAKALDAKLTQAEGARVANVPTRNQAAYDAFLKAEYYAQKGGQQSSAADYQNAFEYYGQAVAADPDFALAWAQLARRQLEYIHFFGSQPGLAAQAKTALDHALTLQPTLEEAHVAQGLYWMFGGAEDFPAASSAFATAHALKPQDWFPIFLGGILSEDQFHLDAAIESFRKASALNPRQLSPLTEMAFDYAKEHKYVQAVHVLKHALAVDPASWHAAAQLAGIYALMGDLDGMHSVFDAAPASVTSQPFVMVLRAQYLIYRRDWIAAYNALLKIQAADPKSPKTACQLAEVANLSGNSAQARTYYQRCAELAAKNQTSEQQGYAGLALVHLNQTHAALALGQRAVAESASGRMSEYVSALLLMARIDAQAGLAKNATITLERLFSLRGSSSHISVPLLKLDPTWDPIRDDPRFQALLKKYGKVEHAPSATSAGSAPNA